MKFVQTKQLMHSRGEPNPAHALFDIREAGEIHDGHIPGATALPRRMIELRIGELVMAKDTPIVVYDEGGPRGELAAQTLERLGYGDVAVLQGGTAAWIAEGGKLVEGRNVPSKLFAEQMFVEQSVPQITAETLHEWSVNKTPHVILDIREPEEHRIGHVPNAYNVPGVEVTPAAPDLEKKQVPIVVHCAGRTRSILACQTLRELGLDNVYALKNGTMGWTLAGFELARDVGSPYEGLSPAGRDEGTQRARKLAASLGVELLDATKFAAWSKQAAAGEINLYAFDVRQAGAYIGGHIPGTKSVPGGQAFLFADDHTPAREAPVVCIDDGEAQAPMTAYWFKRLGYPRVYVLEGGIRAWKDTTSAELEIGKSRPAPLGFKEAKQQTQQVDAGQLAALLDADPQLSVIDVNTSKNFSAGHLKGANWVSRGWLESRLEVLLPEKNKPVAVVCQNGVQSSYAGATLHSLGYTKVYVLSAGLAAWKKAGLPLQTGAPATDSADVVKSPYERTKEDMVRYLHWEEQLADKPAKGANKAAS